MGDNEAINNLTGASVYSGCYWKEDDNIGSNGISNKLVYTEDLNCVKSNWDYGFTLNEDYVKEIVKKITKERELARLTPDEGPEIPKWTGFLPI